MNESTTTTETTTAPVWATRTTVGTARRFFEAGGEVLVSEHGADMVLVTESTVTHSAKTTTWKALRAEVIEWRHRYPGQRFYTVLRGDLRIEER
jgi:hypothetical protein